MGISPELCASVPWSICYWTILHLDCKIVGLTMMNYCFSLDWGLTNGFVDESPFKTSVVAMGSGVDWLCFVIFSLWKLLKSESKPASTSCCIFSTTLVRTCIYMHNTKFIAIYILIVCPRKHRTVLTDAKTALMTSFGTKASSGGRTRLMLISRSHLRRLRLPLLTEYNTPSTFR